MTAKPPPFSLWMREFPHLAQVWAGRFRRPHAVTVEKRAFPPVLVIPGIVSSDYATSLLRRTFSETGFPAYASNLGLVTGVTDKALAKAQSRLSAIHSRHSEPVVIVGWSLGGIFARVLAQRHPEQVRMVVTLGSPFSGDRRANNAWRLYNAINDHTVDAPVLPDDPSQKPSAHTVAVWSPIDGVIAPECARGQSNERDVEIEMAARHFEFGTARAPITRVIQIVSEQLSYAR